VTGSRPYILGLGMFSSVMLGGCVTVGSSTRIDPVPEPTVRISPPPVADLSDPYLSPPPAVVDDPIVGSRWANDPAIRERSTFWMEYWKNRGARDFQLYLDRLEWYRPLVEKELAGRDLPASLLYLPIIESGYTARAVSEASAVGLWQLMAGTARARGLTVTPILDERRDPVRATPEALGFLHELYERFGSWYLALAAYNGGPGRMSRLLRDGAPLAPVSDSLFVELRHRLPAETRDFIPKLIAAATLASQPARYGFSVSRGPSFAYDEVVIADAVSVDVIATAAGATQAEIETLNPQLLRGFTPPGTSTVVRVPEGKGLTFDAGLATIPESERLSFLEHRVVSGETFSHIARRYGVRVAMLQAANPEIRPRRLQIGQWVVVPVAPASSPRSQR
jgi:peptidoglycan lytic transglycosylase D